MIGLTTMEIRSIEISIKSIVESKSVIFKGLGADMMP